MLCALSRASLVGLETKENSPYLFSQHNYAIVSAPGVVIYSSYNNSLYVVQTVAELLAQVVHSGRGLDVLSRLMSARR